MAGSGSSFFQNLISTMVGVSLGGFAVVLSSFLLFGMTLAFFASSSGDRPDELAKSEYTTVQGDKKSINLLMQVDVTGPILGRKDKSESPFSNFSDKTFGYEIRERLNKYAENKKIKGLLMVFKSPGGTIFGSRAIFEAINDYREKSGNPVYAFVEGLSASGGVMAMVAADKIYADYGSLVGSVGVIGGQFFYFDGLKEVNGGLLGQGYSTSGGITAYTISAGRSKDLGNPFRKPTEQELEELKVSIDKEYNSFVELVAESRQIEKTVITNDMGAMIMGNPRAEELGLIDGTLDYYEAVQALADQLELGDDWRLVTDVAPMGPLQKFLSAAFVDKQRSISSCNSWVLKYPLAYHGNPAEICY